jgi:hypothetical protein
MNKKANINLIFIITIIIIVFFIVKQNIGNNYEVTYLGTYVGNSPELQQYDLTQVGDDYLWCYEIDGENHFTNFPRSDTMYRVYEVKKGTYKVYCFAYID